MGKLLRLLLLVPVMCIAGAAAFLYYYYDIRMKMNAGMVNAAEQALQNGITVEDPQDDFVITASNKEEVNSEENPSPYKLAYLDVKSFSAGVDEKYIYYQVAFHRKFPTSPENINGDIIDGLGCNLLLQDRSGKDQQILHTDFSYIMGMLAPSTYYFYEPTGIEWPEEKRFSHKDSDSKFYGGAGTDYVMGAFPLAKLGLRPGQELRMSLSMEARSKKYTHAAVDNLLGSGKSPAIIVWKMGSKQYTITENPVNGK